MFTTMGPSVQPSAINEYLVSLLPPLCLLRPLSPVELDEPERDAPGLLYPKGPHFLFFEEEADSSLRLILSL